MPSLQLPRKWNMNDLNCALVSIYLVLVFVGSLWFGNLCVPSGTTAMRIAMQTLMHLFFHFSLLLLNLLLVLKAPMLLIHKKYTVCLMTFPLVFYDVLLDLVLACAMLPAAMCRPAGPELGAPDEVLSCESSG